MDKAKLHMEKVRASASDAFKSGNKMKIASFVITFLLILVYELVILYSCFYDWVHLQRAQNLYESTIYIKDHNFMPSI